MITFITKYYFLKSSFYIEKATDFYLFCQPSINSFAREFIFLQMSILVIIKSKISNGILIFFTISYIYPLKVALIISQMY
jgi:hypothetical protein